MNPARKYPFLTCLIVALLLRLIAVLFSRGFMASDDYFETVKIAYQGVQSGLTNAQGLLQWNTVQSTNIGRSPLYVLFLYSIMGVQNLAGIANLDSMMYLIRSIHALLSLLTIWFGYRYIFESTRDKDYALLGGLILGAHFLAPYLAVRNLIEQVSADLFVPAIFLAYKGVRDQRAQYLILAGILSGVSWMIRFNMALAILPIPFATWYLTRNLRPALYYSAGLLIIILFSGSLDMIYLGHFGQSSLNILRSFFFSIFSFSPAAVNVYLAKVALVAPLTILPDGESVVFSIVNVPELTSWSPVYLLVKPAQVTPLFAVGKTLTPY